jgi:endonuclease-3
MKHLAEILRELDKHYPHGESFLAYGTPFELLAATILSAQCTDERVNATTAVLFKRYANIEDYAHADITELETIIMPCGLFRSKAKSIIGSAQAIINNFSGNVPNNLEGLLTLPGVGRKTANLILGHVYRVPSIVVDTHVRRVTYRLGMTTTLDATKSEFQLMELLPKSYWIPINQQLINLGRKLCKAQNPNCANCFLNTYCEKKMK